MKLPNPYFQDVPGYGNLYVEQVIVEYVYPLLSVLKDSSGQRYLCMCFDTRGMQQWLISPISVTSLVRMLTIRLTLKDSFVRDTDTVIYAYRNYETRTDSFARMTPGEVPAEYLPEQGEYLDAEQGEWDAYIAQLNTSMEGWIGNWVEPPIYVNKIVEYGVRIFMNTNRQYPAPEKTNKQYENRVLAAQCIPSGVY